MAGEKTSIKLPELYPAACHPIERLLAHRRSVRDFAATPLSLEELAHLLWAAQGVSSPEGLRTAPSAGALYPLAVHLVAGNVKGLECGSYHYRPHAGELVLTAAGDRRQPLAAAALGQGCVSEAAAVLVLSAVFERTTQKYGQRGIQYVHMEVGHAAQNVYLAAGSLGLGTVMVGAFDDQGVKRAVPLEGSEVPLALMPLGRPL